MNKKNREIMIRSAFRRFPINLYKTAASLISMAISSQKAPLPYKLQIESAGICNLKCGMCPQNNMKRKRGFLKFDLFKKIFDEVRPPYLNLTGFGEPLLNPELFDIIRYAKDKGTFIKLDTNATLLDEKKADLLLKSGIDLISISLDGMDKKTYEKIRIGANFEEVIKNLKNLVKKKKELNAKTEIHLFLVLQRDNFKQFPDFIKFGDSFGADSISGTFVAEESYAKNRDISIEQCDEKELFKLAKELEELKSVIKANLEIDEIIIEINGYLQARNKQKNRGWSKVPCYKPWYSPFITWDGILCLCCYCVDKEIVLGDLKKRKFREVWNGEKMQAYRKMIATNRIGLCTKCGSDETYIYNQLKRIPLLNLFKGHNFPEFP